MKNGIVIDHNNESNRRECRMWCENISWDAVRIYPNAAQCRPVFHVGLTGCYVSLIYFIILLHLILQCSKFIVR